MVFGYNIFIQLYRMAIGLASLWNPKAKRWLDGRKDIFREIEKKNLPDKKNVWFHCASLGEFEQGRPLLEEFKIQHPEFNIVLTFFSPSGYEIRKDYPGAALILYLPLDTAENAERFINAINPQMVFFIKYEFWYHYLNTLQMRNIPVYIVAANFIKSQIFFRWYGFFNRRILKKVTHFFVQNKTSLNLLNSIGLDNVSISGDTRFDRVQAISKQRKQIPFLAEFKNKNKIFIAGSTWPEDHKILISFFIHQKQNTGLKFIVAPHEIVPAQIDALINQLEKEGIPCLKYSLAGNENIAEARVLIIDSIGILSSLYQYAELAYSGGGFGKGIHNILEAATFGLPVFFGPEHSKFQEALDLIDLGGAFCIHNAAALNRQFDAMLQQPEKSEKATTACLTYTKAQQGATKNIMHAINTHLPDAS